MNYLWITQPTEVLWRQKDSFVRNWYWGEWRWCQETSVFLCFYSMIFIWWMALLTAFTKDYYLAHSTSITTVLDLETHPIHCLIYFRASPPAEDSPPKKKQRVSGTDSSSSSSTMQTQQQATNGDVPVKNGVSNGVHAEHDSATTISASMSIKSNEDLVRIIGQHLISLGLS